jgi:hypothetical protein
MKGKTWSDVAMLKGLARKLEQVERRQGQIFAKFVKMHEALKKKKDLVDIDDQLVSIQQMVGSLNRRSCRWSTASRPRASPDSSTRPSSS